MSATILLVEDSKLLKITGERLLTKAGYTVVTAQDGEQALSTVRQTHPDLVLLDMLLPKIGGQQVLEAMKKDPATANIPVIILSSLSQQNEEKMKKAGAAAYFEKAKIMEAANSAKLIEAIEGILQKSKSPTPDKLAASNQG